MSRIWTYYRGAWHEGDVRVLGANSHATWLGSLVFDGARAFEGVAPDLDRHAARVNRSARNLGLEPTLSDAEIVGLTEEGLKKFERGLELAKRCRLRLAEVENKVVRIKEKFSDFADGDDAPEEKDDDQPRLL